MAGRKTKYSEEKAELICQHLRDGSTDKAAYESEGIHASTFYEWIETKPEFSEAVTRARAEAERNFAFVIKEAAKAGDWRAAESWLKRRRREEWGDRVTQEVSGPDGKPIQTEDVSLSHEQRIERLAQLLESARTRRDGSAA